jgi:5-methylcytosine-specific restriction endonuclease McrA
MSDFLNKYTVLVLNSLYQCIGILTPKKALITLNSSSEQNNIVAKVIDVTYKKNEDGSLNLDELDFWQPLTFEEWLMVDPRKDIDKIIHTCRLQLRSPTVIVTNYSKMPMKKTRVSKGVLYDIQGGKCAYSGEKIPMKRGNLEHRQPKSHGGKDTFENLLFVKTEINSRRGNKSLKEAGLRSIFPPHRTPKPIPYHFTIKNYIHPDWRWFVNQQ